MTTYANNSPLYPETEKFMHWYISQREKGLLSVGVFAQAADGTTAEGLGLECPSAYEVWPGRGVSPVPADVVGEKFRRLTANWREDVRFLSDTNEICSHPAYQEIIGMGVSVLPFIFEELAREPDNWFWALKAITGQDPVREEHRGNVDLMARDWLQLAQQFKDRSASDFARFTF